MASMTPVVRREASSYNKKRVKRIGIQIDMTPLVDVAFLLLTFFMLTTSMTRSQAMELNIPSSDEPLKVYPENLLTLRVNARGEIFWNVGFDEPRRIRFAELRTLLVQKLTNNPRIATVVKIARECKYDMMVNIIDEINLAKVERFSLAPMLESDTNVIANL